MMQAAEPWHRNNLATHIGSAYCFTKTRCSLRQREVRPIVVVITDVIIHEALEVPFADDDHMVEKIPAAVADPAFGDTVLPRASKAGSFGINAEALHGVDHFFIEVCAAIKDQVFRSRVVGECLAQLLDHPCGGRMLGRVEVKNSPPIMRDNEEAVPRQNPVRLYFHSFSANTSPGESNRLLTVKTSGLLFNFSSDGVLARHTFTF